jgi:hypothetical protein
MQQNLYMQKISTKSFLEFCCTIYHIYTNRTTEAINVDAIIRSERNIGIVVGLDIIENLFAIDKRRMRGLVFIKDTGFHFHHYEVCGNPVTMYSGNNNKAPGIVTNVIDIDKKSISSIIHSLIHEVLEDDEPYLSELCIVDILNAILLT